MSSTAPQALCPATECTARGARAPLSSRQRRRHDTVEQVFDDPSNAGSTERERANADAAQILMVSRPRVSDVMNQKTSKFTIDTLVDMPSRVGKPVRLAVG